jgi:hypothetical protein
VGGAKDHPITADSNQRGESTMRRNVMRCTAFALATLALILTGDGGRPSVAGTSTPNVSGTWEGAWTHEIGSGQITL